MLVSGLTGVRARAWERAAGHETGPVYAIIHNFHFKLRLIEKGARLKADAGTEIAPLGWVHRVVASLSLPVRFRLGMHATQEGRREERESDR